MDKHITAPFDKKQVEELHAGDYVPEMQHIRECMIH